MKKEIIISEFPAISYPASAVLVTCIDSNKEPNIITIAWHTPLSIHPPLYGIAIAPKRYSHDLIKTSKEFIVNFLSYENILDIHLCGTTSGKTSKKIDNCTLSYEPSTSMQTPRIKEAYAHMECQLYDTIQTGDHSLFMGKVTSLLITNEAFDKKCIMKETMKPAYYLGNNAYTTISEKRHYL